MMTYVKQAQNVYAKELGPNADLTLTDFCVNQGGILHANQGGGTVHLQRVWSEGAPANGGVYAVLLATHPVLHFVWDNTGLKDKWITNGDEAAFRVMGHAKLVELTGIDFRCTKKPVKGVGIWSRIVRKIIPKMDFWKQVAQFRFADLVFVTNCRFIGPIDIGRQKDPGGVGQVLRKIVFKNVGFTHWPSISTYDSVGEIHYQGCYFIGEDGKPTGKTISDKVVRGTAK